MIRTQLYLPDQLYAQAKLRAQLEGVTISQLMREGLQLKLSATAKKNARKNKSGKAKDPFAGLVGKYGKDWPPSDVARNHDEIYDL